MLGGVGQVGKIPAFHAGDAGPVKTGALSNPAHGQKASGCRTNAPITINLKRHRAIERRIAEERVKILLENAIKMAGVDEKLARRQIDLAKRIATRYNLRRQRLLKRYFICRYCKRSLIPGRESKIRVKNGKIKVTCLFCGSVKRIVCSSGMKRSLPAREPKRYKSKRCSS